MFDQVQECSFESGAKVFYAFESLPFDFDHDLLSELSDFNLAGPLRESLPETSQYYSEFLLSRFLLLRLLKNFKSKNVGGVSFSLSHTSGAALVAGAATLSFEGASLAAGIGADVEALTRKISDPVYKRICNGAFDSQVAPLVLWSLKEAAYKAHPNNENLLLSDFVVVENPGALHFKLMCSKSSYNFEAVLIERMSYQLAFARLLKD
ncbi:MAG: 4'-phosphopantetheinyl transferase superfamily protein [Bdellovibrionota bacterium]